MSRPCKKRRLVSKPNVFYFKPAGIQKKDLKEINMNHEEFEALKLIDLEKIPQSEAGKKMNISQPTLSRILQSSRNKIANAIINGKAIKIETWNQFQHNI